LSRSSLSEYAGLEDETPFGYFSLNSVQLANVSVPPEDGVLVSAELPEVRELVECFVVPEPDVPEDLFVDDFAHPLNPESVTNPFCDHMFR